MDQIFARMSSAVVRRFLNHIFFFFFKKSTSFSWETLHRFIENYYFLVLSVGHCSWILGQSVFSQVLLKRRTVDSLRSIWSDIPFKVGFLA